MKKSKVSIIVPGSLITEDQLKNAVKTVKSLGFEPHVPKDAELPFLLKDSKAKDISEKEFLIKKFQHIKQAFKLRDSVAIWCVRGGYGSQKLMPYFKKLRRPSRFKMFIGYSDATVIHTYLNLSWKWPTMHFPVIEDLKGASADSLKRVVRAVKEKKNSSQTFSNLAILNNKKFKKPIRSSVVGGNLTLIQSSIGTPWAASSFKGKILFLEDVSEQAYRIDRALWQMESAGVFKGIKACVLGDFVGADKSELTKVFKIFAHRVSFPVITGVPSGHGLKKEPVPFLTPASLEFHPTSSQAKLKIRFLK